MNLSIRELEVDEAYCIPEYFHGVGEHYLRSMGVDPHKLPEGKDWQNAIIEDLARKPTERQNCFVLWMANGIAVGHANVNDIEFGQKAYLHLHLWSASNREKGNGSFFLKESVKFYFRRFQLETLHCRPFAFNTAPNRTLKRIGFNFVRAYETIPGKINFYQTVNEWKIERPIIC